jgi:hypothetical protein
MVEITERAIALAVTQERERCARVCEEEAERLRRVNEHVAVVCFEDAARRIRDPTP